MKNHDIAEVYESSDKEVFKYIHYNGVENCLKLGQSCTDEGALKENNKAVLFLSSSYGCKQRCKFCYLTNKKICYRRLGVDEIVNMAIAIIENQKELLKNKYFKISFMGMGDIFAEDLPISWIVEDILSYIYKNDICLGIDGIDFGTSMPSNDNIKYQLREIGIVNKMINENFINTGFLKLNPRNSYSLESNYNITDRTVVRLFISLHTINNREELMPNCMSIDDIIEQLSGFPVDIVFHQMFFDGINDALWDIYLIHDLIEFDFKKSELRLLRFNKCDNIENKLEESKKIDEIIEFFKQSNIKFKYQLSAGSEIKAACGQFLCKIGGE